jgi:tetratricopeptide (TPR) repeat protein
MVEFPNDGRVLLFLSQSLFAMGDYQGAITAAYHGMSLLETEDWGYVVQNYTRYYGKDDYVTQMNKLNEYIKANPNAAYAHALRGYQFGYLGHEEQARKDLGKAIELEQRDEFAARLVNQFGGHAELPPPEPPPETVGPADPSSEAATTPENSPPDTPDES